VRQHLTDHLDRYGGWILPLDVWDQPTANAKPPLRLPDPLAEAVDDRGVGDAAARVQRRREEHLAVAEVAELDAVLDETATAISANSPNPSKR